MASEPNELEVDWQNLLADLANLSSTGFRLVNPEGRLIAEAGPEAPVCQIVHKSKAGRRYCEQHCWSQVSLVAPKDSHTCRAQIARIEFPVEVGGHVVGYLLCGGDRSDGQDQRVKNRFDELESQLDLSVTELLEAYQRSQSNSPNQVEELRQSLGHLVEQKLSESIQSAAIRAIRQHALEVDSGGLWRRLADTILFVLAPVREIEIFVFAPARDAVDRVWPEQGWDGSDQYDDFRAAEGHPAHDKHGRLIILVESKDKDRVLGRVSSSAVARETPR